MVQQESRAKVALQEQEQEDNSKLHTRVTSLCQIRVTTPSWHMQTPRWMAWTLGPAAAQGMPKESPLDPEALGHH